MSHANARLTVHGRRLIIDRARKGGRKRTSLPLWGYRVGVCSGGSAGTGTKAKRAWSTGRLAH